MFTVVLYGAFGYLGKLSFGIMGVNSVFEIMAENAVFEKTEFLGVLNNYHIKKTHVLREKTRFLME